MLIGFNVKALIAKLAVIATMALIVLMALIALMTLKPNDSQMALIFVLSLK